jgi:hypothetical protein
MNKLLFALLLLTICLRAQTPNEIIKAATVNGHPALVFPGTGDLNGHPGFSSVVERSGTDAAPVYIFHLTLMSMHYCPGLFTLNSERAIWQPESSEKCEKSAYDQPRSGFSIYLCCAKDSRQHIDDVAIVKFGKEQHWFMGDSGLRIDATHRSKDMQAARSKPLFDFFYLTVTNFSAAEAEFWRLRGDFMTPEALVTFHEQAAAWRALSVKPDLSEEARRQRLLAESYLREKDFKGSIEHYKLGLRADLTWPEGWFNLALLYAETSDYSAAAASMKNYLELMPNSTDAAAARDKIVLWEDKAQKP